MKPDPLGALRDSLSRRLQRSVTDTHARLYRATNGAIGHRVLGMRCLLLETIGARTGQRRTAVLGYVREGEDLVLAASNGGSDRPPGWFVNLEKDDTVLVQIGAERFAGTARVLRQGERRYDRLFAELNSHFGGRYYAYQAKTSRPIPIVLISPLH